MVLLWRHSEEPFSVPDGTFMFLCVETLTTDLTNDQMSS